MITIEQVEELRKRVHVSYEDAKAALEEANGDILEAIIIRLFVNIWGGIFINPAPLLFLALILCYE